MRIEVRERFAKCYSGQSIAQVIVLKAHAGSHALLFVDFAIALIGIDQIRIDIPANNSAPIGLTL